MPIISGLQSSLVRDANTALATAFFPRFLKSWWPQIARSTLSTALVEPFALDGSAPPLQRFYGTLKMAGLASWSYNSPNFLFKNGEEIDREQLEMDQTGTILKRIGQFGIRVAQAPDFLLAKRLLTADQTSSATTVYRGQSYSTTFENGIPLFSSSHNMYSGNTQSNIITGNLPSAATTASIAANDIGAIAQLLLRDYTLILDKIASLVDDKGVQLYPDFEPEKSLILVAPPILRDAFDVAFESVNQLIGGSPSTSTGSTGSTSIQKKRVKRVLTPGLLRGCLDIESEVPGTTVTPQYATQYYYFIEDDYVAPFYFQRFRPKKGGEFCPVGSDPEAEAQAALDAAKSAGLNATVESADMYAATEISSNFSALGNEAQESVVMKEKFFIAGRSRFQFNYGFWPTAGKIDPAGASL